MPQSEYKVTFKATIPGLFSSKTVTEVKVYEAPNSRAAIEKAKQHLKSELAKKGLDPEEDGFTVTITDVEKL